MTNWLVSRHLGAIEWIQLQGIKIDKELGAKLKEFKISFIEG